MGNLLSCAEPQVQAPYTGRSPLTDARYERGRQLGDGVTPGPGFAQPGYYHGASNHMGRHMEQQQQQQPASTTTTNTTTTTSEHLGVQEQQAAVQPQPAEQLQHPVPVPAQPVPAQEALEQIQDASRSDSRPQPGPPLNWKKGKLIGAGAFGRVFMGLDNETGHIVAVKQVALTKDEALKGRVSEHIQALEAEVAVLQQLSHRNIVHYMGTERTEDTLNIFLEYVPGGSIATMVERFGPLQEMVIRKYTQQILQGLEYLHRKGIMHRDIKGANILVDPMGVVKLADFGASKKIEDLVTINSGCKSIRGTPYWMAPEVIKQTGTGRPADIWSMACVVIEMATGKPPWSNCTTQVAAMFFIASAREPPPLPDCLSAEAKHFLLLCFNRTPKERPNATRLLRHPWMANIPNPQSSFSTPSASASLQVGSSSGCLNSSVAPIPAGAAVSRALPAPAPAQGAQRHPLVPPLQLQRVFSPPSPVKEEVDVTRSGSVNAVAAPVAAVAASQRSSRILAPSPGAMHLPLGVGIGPLEQGRRRPLMAQPPASLAATTGLPPLHPGSTVPRTSQAQVPLQQPLPLHQAGTHAPVPPVLSPLSQQQLQYAPALPPAVGAAQGQSQGSFGAAPAPAPPAAPTGSAQVHLQFAQDPTHSGPAQHTTTGRTLQNRVGATPPPRITTTMDQVPEEQYDTIISPSGIPAALLAAAAASAAAKAAVTATLPTSLPPPSDLTPPMLAAVVAAPGPAPAATLRQSVTPGERANVPSAPAVTVRQSLRHSMRQSVARGGDGLPALNYQTLDWNPMEEPSWMPGTALLGLPEDVRGSSGGDSRSSSNPGLAAIAENSGDMPRMHSSGSGSMGGDVWGEMVGAMVSGRGSGASSPGLDYRKAGGAGNHQQQAFTAAPGRGAGGVDSQEQQDQHGAVGARKGLQDNTADGVVVVVSSSEGNLPKGRSGGRYTDRAPAAAKAAHVKISPRPATQPEQVSQTKEERWQAELIAELEKERAARALSRSSSGGGVGGGPHPPRGGVASSSNAVIGEKKRVALPRASLAMAH